MSAIGRAAVLAAALVLAACGGKGGETQRAPSPADPAALDTPDPAEGQLPPLSDAAEQAETPAADEKGDLSLADIDALRAANFYRLDWQGDAALCSAALSSLNRPFAPAAEAVADRAGDYADEQALKYLGTDDNVRWTAPSGENAPPSAMIDYFNDGVSRRILRMFGKLAGSSIIGLGVDESGGVSMLAFGHAGLASPAMPAIDNLHGKLTYSVSDVILLPGGAYTLVAPLLDVDPSRRVFLISWRAKDETTPPRKAIDFYPAVECAFSPAAGAR